MKKIIKVLSKIVTVLVLIYTITVVPVIFSYHPLVVLSGSMEPTIKVGSLIYYKEKNDYNVNDIISFNIKGQTVTHRIVEVLDDNYITKGDANKSNDLNPIKKDNIKGKVSNININYIGYYLKFLNDNKFVVFLMFLILSTDILINKGDKNEI